jgi:hypothetical protein
MQQTEPGPLKIKQMVKGLGFRHNNDKRNKAYTYACGGWSSNSSCPQAFSSLDFQCRCDISELDRHFGIEKSLNSPGTIQRIPVSVSFQCRAWSWLNGIGSANWLFNEGRCCILVLQSRVISIGSWWPWHSWAQEQVQQLLHLDVHSMHYNTAQMYLEEVACVTERNSTTVTV